MGGESCGPPVGGEGGACGRHLGRLWITRLPQRPGSFGQAPEEAGAGAVAGEAGGGVAVVAAELDLGAVEDGGPFGGGGVAGLHAQVEDRLAVAKLAGDLDLLDAVRELEQAARALEQAGAEGGAQAVADDGRAVAGEGPPLVDDGGGQELVPVCRGAPKARARNLKVS